MVLLTRLKSVHSMGLRRTREKLRKNSRGTQKNSDELTKLHSQINLELPLFAFANFKEPKAMENKLDKRHQNTHQLLKQQNKLTPTFPPLETVTRPNLTTAEYAYYRNIKPKTAHIHACKGTGGISPLRVNGRLQWNTDAVRALLGVAK